MEDLKKTIHDIRPSRLVFDMRFCRKLLQADCRVIDCKPLKTDKSKTVLVFLDDEHFKQEYERIVADFKEKDEAKHEASESKELED